MPAAVPPHKQRLECTPAPQRLEMLELAIAGHPAFSVCRYEVDRGGVNYSVETLAHFREETPDHEFFFLMGADMLSDLPYWRSAERVCELAVPIAVRRPGVPKMDFRCLEGVASPERIAMMRELQVEMPEIGISSTEIRHRIRQGRSIRYWVPRAVEQYIQTHALYVGAAQSRQERIP